MTNPTRLRALRDALHPGTALDELQWLDLVTVIDTILEGRDARALYGIAPKLGAPSTTRAIQTWIAVHLAALRALKPDEAAKRHCGIVATAWGTTDNQVAKLARKHQPRVVAVLAGTTPEAAIQTANILAKYFAQPTKVAIKGRRS